MATPSASREVTSPTPTEVPWRPTRDELRRARTRRVPDLIAPSLRVLFVGINPGLYSGAVRHHFARPGNRFWKVLHAAGFTARVLSPFEERALLADGYGITNLVLRTTAAADELSVDELTRGGRSLVRKVRRWRPGVVAFLGVEAYRAAFGARDATVGRQTRRIGGATVWVLPNPSGLNAHYQLPALTALFTALRREALNA